MYLREMELQLLSYYFLLLSYVKLIITDQLYIFNILPVNLFFYIIILSELLNYTYQNNL